MRCAEKVRFTMAMPNFLIIGAARSGTTSLYYYLAQHPQVFLCPVKEANYFALAGQSLDFRGGAASFLNGTSVTDRDRYEALFDGANGEPILGDVSPRYLSDANAAARIAAEAPDARLVAVLRNPVQRGYSAYLRRVRDGIEPASDFREAIRDEPRRLRERWATSGYVTNGFYARQLQPYSELFGKERMRIYRFEQLQTDPASLLRDLCQFLEITATFPVDYATSHNPSGIMPNRWVRLAWRKSHGLRGLVRPLLPQGVRHWAFQQVNRNLIKPELPEDLERELIEVYREDIQQLEQMLGWNLESWLQPRSRKPIAERHGQAA